MKNNKLSRMLVRFVPMSMIVALPFFNSCEKTEELQERGTKDVVIDLDWQSGDGWAPSKEFIKSYTSQQDVKSVYINLVNKNPKFPEETGCVCSKWSESMFKVGRDSLQECFFMSSKVHGSGTIVLSKIRVLKIYLLQIAFGS